MIDPFTPEWLWVVIVGFIVSFALAFGIGANDVANSFGTSVGSRVLTIRWACFLATIFEILGAVLIGYKVSDTMRKGILDVNVYNNSEPQLMLGSLSALGGSAIWLLMATFFKLPVSGTHSIVGATIGFSLVARGTRGVNWTTLLKIVGSWFVSPVLSGLMSCCLFICIRQFILSKKDPLRPGLQSLPIFYGITLLVNVFSIVHDGSSLLYFDHIPWWGAVIISFGVSLLTAIVVHTFVVPWMRRKVLRSLAQESSSNQVTFTFGGSAESSVNPSPQESKNISLEDVHKAEDGMPIYSSSQSKSMVSTLNGHLAPPHGGKLYQFPHVNGHFKGSKYIAAETKLNNKEEAQIGSDNGLVTTSAATVNVPTGATANGTAPVNEMIGSDMSQLTVPSGQVTPCNGLSPNSSVVHLISDRSTASLEPLVQEKKVKTEAPEVSRLFSFLQVLTATFGSFAHGGNDVSNAIGPLIALWMIYSEGSVAQKSQTPIYILLYGGVGISLGLWIWGRRVIKTLGEDLTKITPSSGFTIEFGAALTVLIASKIGLPISTTHCKVGSVVFVGWLRSTSEGVDWKLFRNIIFAWLITVPVAGGLSGGIMAILQEVAL